MQLILLPLLRFVCAILSISFARARKPFTILSHVVDAALLSQLVLTLVRGTPEMVTVGGAPAGIGISLIGDQLGLTFAVLAWILSVAISCYTWKDKLRPYFFLLRLCPLRKPRLDRVEDTDQHVAQRTLDAVGWLSAGCRRHCQGGGVHILIVAAFSARTRHASCLSTAVRPGHQDGCSGIVPAGRCVPD